MRTKHGWIKFKEWGAPDPHDERLGNACHVARYNLPALTQAQAYRLCEAVSAYVHFAGYQGPSGAVLSQLRELRRRVRELDATDVAPEEATP